MFISESLTNVRQWSEETTMVSLKCSRAKVDLPQPGAPQRTRSVVRGKESTDIAPQVIYKNLFPSRDTVNLWFIDIQVTVPIFKARIRIETFPCQA
jgi:hypothetical protein